MEQTKANRPLSYDYPCERGADMERTNNGQFHERVFTLRRSNPWQPGSTVI